MKPASWSFVAIDLSLRGVLEWVLEWVLAELVRGG